MCITSSIDFVLAQPRDTHTICSLMGQPSFFYYSPIVLEFDLKLIARKTFSTASYTEKYALQHTESPKESSEGKAWKMSHTVNKFIRIISININ